MGYETRMYIGVPYCGNEKEPYIQIEGQSSAFRVFNDGNKRGDYFYLSDGNTKRYVAGLKRRGVAHEIVQAQLMQVVAMVDLCKASSGEVGDVISKGHAEGGDCGGFYDDGGNAAIIKDCYGACMTFVSPQEVLAAMKAHKEPYRRFAIAIATLEAAIKGFPCEPLQVLFFGY